MGWSNQIIRPAQVVSRFIFVFCTEDRDLTVEERAVPYERFTYGDYFTLTRRPFFLLTGGVRAENCCSGAVDVVMSGLSTGLALLDGRRRRGRVFTLSRRLDLPRLPAQGCYKLVAGDRV